LKSQNLAHSMIKKFLDQDKQVPWLVLIFGLITIIWVSQGFYQSHYLSALRILGDYETKNILGYPREGRGDEWSTYLPILKQAYLEGFPYTSSLEPYHEKFEWVIAIPKLDISLFFLPHHILFFVLPGEYALSTQGIYYNLLLLISISWLLQNLGAKKIVAYTTSIMTLFSHFYQVWWTSNFPALGASILPFAVFSSSLPPRIKYPFLFWSIGHMLFGQIYPPFYLSLIFGVLPLVLITKPEIFTKKNLFFSFLGPLMALICFILMKLDYFFDVSNTSYPGARFSTGGDVNLQFLFSMIVPTIPILEKDILSIYTGAVGTILPLFFLSLLPFIKWDNFSKKVTAVAVTMALVIGSYMVIGFPDWLSRISFFYLVPGKRMIIGLSLLINFYSAIMISHHWHKISVISLILFNASLLGTSLFGIREDMLSEFYAMKWYYLAPSFLSIIGVTFYFITKKRAQRESVIYVVLGGMSIFHLISFGSFNPIINAKHILSPVYTQITQDVNALIMKNSGMPVSIVGNYGHILRGEGLAVYNAIHLVNVEKEIYQKYFSVNDEDWNILFNRFVGINFDNINTVQPQTTNTFPATIGGVPFEHTIINKFQNIVDVKEPVSTDNYIISIAPSESGFLIYWKSFLEKPMPISAPIEIRISCDTGNSWLTRYPLNIQTEGISAAALQGLAGITHVNAVDEDNAKECINNMFVYFLAPIAE
jgi:hypothetical protein